MNSIPQANSYNSQKQEAFCENIKSKALMGRFRRDRPQSACQVRSEEKREREIENEVDEAGRSGEAKVSGDAAIRPINAADDLREGPLSCQALLQKEEYSPRNCSFCDPTRCPYRRAEGGAIGSVNPVSSHRICAQDLINVTFIQRYGGLLQPFGENRSLLLVKVHSCNLPSLFLSRSRARSFLPSPYSFPTNAEKGARILFLERKNQKEGARGFLEAQPKANSEPHDARLRTQRFRALFPLLKAMLPPRVALHRLRRTPE